MNKHLFSKLLSTYKWELTIYWDKQLRQIRKQFHVLSAPQIPYKCLSVTQKVNNKPMLKATVRETKSKDMQALSTLI